MTNLLKSVQASFLLVLSFGLSSCDMIYEPFFLKDIGPFYNENEEAFAEILTRYPGPYDSNIPIILAQTREEETEDRPYIEGISGATRMQLIRMSYYPRSLDEEFLSVVLRKAFDGFQLGAIHFHGDQPKMLEPNDFIKVVEGCDDEAEASLTAFRTERRGGSFYCRLSDEWYGFFYWVD